ncbi:MAG: class A beta-lactamase-related serine hydrolase [Planctomycetes bacterium]|nr:class A beta-lactamase-related serine hydrolase [Planctomycetota bacterium]
MPADKRPITIRQLLTHAAGLDHSGIFQSDFEPVVREEAVRRILARPLLFQPGRDSSCSDAGFILLAALIEAKAGVPFVEFMASELLEPLGLARTGFWGADARLAALPDAEFAGGRVDGVEKGGGRRATTRCCRGRSPTTG